MSRPRIQVRLVAASSAVIVLACVLTSCGRSSSPPVEKSPSSSPPNTAAPAAAGKGDFGTAKKICAPGPGTGGSGRGIVGKTIHLGTMADPGSDVLPGIEHEFFDTADAFAKWCNAAGGINGRTIVIDKLDAKLFNGAQQVIDGCRKDFMLVGGGNALDAPDVKPRLACKLGQIPAYTVSPEASAAGLQVTPLASVPDTFGIGALRLLAAAYPDAKQALGIAGSSLASLAPQGLRAQEAYQKLGYKVTTVQPRPAQVNNYRPWIEQLRSSGAKADFESTATNLSPILTAINDVGWNPSFILFSTTLYSADSVAAAKSAKTLPPSYVNFSNLPFELADQFPVVAEAKSIMLASKNNPSFTSFTALAFNSWVLWAQSATACGNNLTQACILEKAGSHTDYDAGGLFAPVNTNPKANKPSDCILLMRLTPDGYVYDKRTTQPNKGVYNCDPKNLVTTKTYQSS